MCVCGHPGPMKSCRSVYNRGGAIHLVCNKTFVIMKFKPCMVEFFIFEVNCIMQKQPIQLKMPSITIRDFFKNTVFLFCHGN